MPSPAPAGPAPAPAPVPSPLGGAPATAPPRPAPPAGMRYNLAGKLVPIRNPGPGAPPLPGPPVAPPPMAKPPAPVTPFVPPGAPPPAPQGNGGWGMPAGAPPQGPGGSRPGFQPGDFNDPFNMFLAAVPGMNLNMQKQIGDAMATAGFSGNRYSSSAENAAGQIGAQNALDQNALLQKTLYDYANQRENRGLQADQLGLQTGQALDEMQRNRLQVPWGMGQFEQSRQDNFANQRYQDFESNKLGWLPMLLNAANSQGAGSPGSLYQTSQPGSPGLAPWISLLGNLFGGGG